MAASRKPSQFRAESEYCPTCGARASAGEICLRCGATLAAHEPPEEGSDNERIGDTEASPVDVSPSETLREAGGASRRLGRTIEESVHRCPRCDQPMAMMPNQRLAVALTIVGFGVIIILTPLAGFGFAVIGFCILALGMWLQAHPRYERRCMNRSCRRK